MAKGKSIIDYAIAQEKEGMDFYNKASLKFNDKDLKEIFLRLAEEEKKHLETFKNFKNEMQKKEIPESYSSKGKTQYLEALIKDSIFPKGDSMSEQIDKIDSVTDACVLAMQAEKESILVYSELAKLAKDKDVKDMLKKLVKEEKKHVGMISRVRADCDPEYAALTLEGSYNPFLYA